MRYKLSDLFDTASDLTDEIENEYDLSLTMGLTSTELNEVLSFVGSVVFGYFYDDLIVYDGETDSEVYGTFSNRLCYDIAVKLPYWYRKYNYVKKLLTDTDFSLLQTSKMTSSSTDKTDSASGTLQKTATTPTGVSTGTSSDGFSVEIEVESDNVTSSDIVTTGFADKYTNAQQKFANAGSVKGERSGEVLREGSIDELINVLEKLPSSFANEISIALQKHFIFDYDGEERGIYNETN